MSFCTVVNCMDGRVQLPVIRYLQNRFKVLYVDSVTEAGPVRSLAKPADETVSQSILRRVAVSRKHGSKVVAVVAHDDCAGPGGRDHAEASAWGGSGFHRRTFPRRGGSRALAQQGLERVRGDDQGTGRGGRSRSSALQRWQTVRRTEEEGTRMHRREDGKPLRTKIVATVGALTHEMYDTGGVEAVRFGGSADDWARFLGWFERDDGYLIDVLRINMSFYQPADDGAPDPDCKELRILSLLRAQRQRFRNLAVLGDLPGPKLRLMGVGEGIALSAGQRVELRLAGDRSAPTICAYGKPVVEEDPGIAERLRGYVAREERPLVSIGDGTATLRLTDVTEDAIVCVSEEDGWLRERKGVTFKGLSLDLRTFREDDERAVDFLLEHGIDWDEHPWDSATAGSFLAFIAVSFVRSAEDVERAKRYVEERVAERLRPRFGYLGEEGLMREARNFAPHIIAKIETKDATEDIERILDVA
ncbi:MAG: hypothetical protein KAS89_09095, partial [Candidatus Eisenbacteria sp.]|nr:hypothetical protein [Candidatus Eisenbacteria bacterium]